MPTTGWTDVGAAAAGERCWIVVPETNRTAASSTYSVYVHGRIVSGQAAFGPPLRPDGMTVHELVAPGVLGVLWWHGGVWVPHAAGMSAGTYDAPFRMGAAAQVAVRVPRLLHHSGH